MSVATPVCRLAFTLTSVPAALPITFPFEQASELLVLNGGQLNTAIDPPVALTLNSDYSVSGGGYNSQNQLLGGNVTVVNTGSHPMLPGDVITVLRNVPETQTTTFKSTGLQTPLMIERNADRATTLTQEIADEDLQSIRISRNETYQPVALRSLRSGQVLGFNRDGTLNFQLSVADLNRLILANPVGGMPNNFDWGVIGVGVQQFFDWGQF